MRLPTPRIVERTAAVLLSAALLAGPAATPPAAAQSDSGSTIKIGVIEMLTGSGAFYGNAVLDGINVAHKELNDKGGIMGKPIELVVQDHASDSVAACWRTITG